jgi:hypothetical protein
MSSDRERVAALLGRVPDGDFDVVVRDASGDPVVIRNAPLLADGTPMPTRYWLVGRRENVAVSRLEADGGVRAAESAIDPASIRAAHDRYAAERDAAVPPDAVHRPSGGVGGTREGVKCLHAHYAWHLAGGDDPVGRWVADELRGRLDVTLSQHRVTVRHFDISATLATTPSDLLAEFLGDGDPPRPEALTNCLGTVSDAVDDLVRDHPDIIGVDRATFRGDEAWHLAQVERGTTVLDEAVVIDRHDLEDLFRTIVAETRADRLHNPAIDPARIDSIVATCCVTLGLMRRLHLDAATFSSRSA